MRIVGSIFFLRLEAEEPDAVVVFGYYVCFKYVRLKYPHTLFMHTSTVVFTGRRFIPTHVGKSFLGDCHLVKNPVHPHACGEKSSSSTGWRHILGSSPRMWGKDGMCLSILVSARFIRLSNLIFRLRKFLQKPKLHRQDLTQH